MPYVKQKNRQLNSTAVISLSFLAVIAVGTILLMLPFSSADGSFTDFFTALKTAVSATSVTGIVPVDTGSYWSIFGQAVILIMIQVGSLGLITFATFFSFILNEKLELRSIKVASESLNVSGIHGIKQLIKSVLKISFICEFAGTLLLMTSYVPRFGLKGLYISVFMSVNAFCNAGLDVMGMVGEPFSSLSALSSDPVTLIVIPALVLAGGVGFFVWTDIIGHKTNKHFALQTKIVLMYTAALTVLGTVLILVFEWDNPGTLGGKGLGYKIGNSFFSTVALRSAGFNTINISAMTPLTKLLSIFYMFIGAAPGATGGGIKITTFAIIVMTVVSIILKRNDTVIMKRKIDKELVYKAMAIMFVFIMIIIAASIIVTFSNDGVTGLDAAFDVTASLTTTGLSTGVTERCGTFSKILLHLLMFIGRVGPISFALSLSMKNTRSGKNEIYPEGKLMVG